MQTIQLEGNLIEPEYFKLQLVADMRCLVLETFYFKYIPQTFEK